MPTKQKAMLSIYRHSRGVIYEIYLSSIQCLRLDTLLEMPIPINKGPVRYGICLCAALYSPGTLSWTREPGTQGVLSLVQWRNEEHCSSRRERKRNSLAWLLPNHGRRDHHFRWSQVGQDLPHSDVNVKSVTITSSKSAFVSDPNFNLAFLSLLPFLSSVEMKNSWSASSL